MLVEYWANTTGITTGRSCRENYRIYIISEIDKQNRYHIANITNHRNKPIRNSTFSLT